MRMSPSKVETTKKGHPTADNGATSEVTTPVGPKGIGPPAYRAVQGPSISALSGGKSAGQAIDSSCAVRVMETTLPSGSIPRSSRGNAAVVAGNLAITYSPAIGRSSTGGAGIGDS